MSEIEVMWRSLKFSVVLFRAQVESLMENLTLPHKVFCFLSALGRSLVPMRGSQCDPRMLPILPELLCRSLDPKNVLHREKCALTLMSWHVLVFVLCLFFTWVLGASLDGAASQCLDEESSM